MKFLLPTVLLATLLLPPVPAHAAGGERELETHLNQLLEKQRRMQASRAGEDELAGMRQRVVKAERELREMRVESAGRKVKHFRAAAEHLRQVGADDLALMLTEKAAVVEREARELKRHLRTGGGETLSRDAGAKNVEDLRRQVERLRLEINEIARAVEELDLRSKKTDNRSPQRRDAD